MYIKKYLSNLNFFFLITCNGQTFRSTLFYINLHQHTSNTTAASASEMGGRASQHTRVESARKSGTSEIITNASLVKYVIKKKEENSYYKVK